MYASNVLAVSGALIVAVAAVPMAGEHHHQHHQREIVWETAIDEVVVTIPVTKTVWIEPGETAPSEPQAHGYGAPSSTPEVQPAAHAPSSAAAPAPAYTPETSSSSVYVAPAPAYTPETSSSVYVAPAPAYTPESSSSVYVAPAPAYTPDTTSSVYVAPSTSTTPVYVAPSPESTYVAPAPSSSYAAPAQSSPAASPSGGSSSGGALTYGMCKSGTTFTGDLTYYQPGLGACGMTNTEQDHIVAISATIFDSYNAAGNSNNNPLCGQYLTITGKDGSPYKAQIVDRCVGCDEGSLDLTQPFFNMVTAHEVDGQTVYGDGRVSGMKWTMD